MTDSRRALERAHYLGENIQQLCGQELGPAGLSMVDWLTSILDVLDPAPPPPGSYLHLLFDLYQREAGNVEDFLSRRGESVPPQVRQHLSDLVEDEIGTTRRALSFFGKDRLGQFDSALRGYSGSEMGTRFADIRRLIVETLIDASPNGYSLNRDSPSAMDIDKMVREMVMSSSQRLWVVSG
jgi:hypothetical protein